MVIVLFITASVYTCKVSAFPITLREPRVDDLSESEEFEIAPYVMKEFMAKPLMTPSIPDPLELLLSDTSLENQGSQPINFENDYYQHKDTNHWKKDVIYIKPLKNSTLSGSSSPGTWKPATNITYGERFLAKSIGTNDCPKGHTYSKLVKRCLKFHATASIIG